MQATGGAPPNDDTDNLDPRQAAALLEQSTDRARKALDPRPPLVMTLMAALVLGGYAALWLSSRGHHPYTGPSGGAVALIYAIVVVTAVVGTKVYRRATGGISGASIRQQRIEGVALGLSVLGSPTIQTAAYHYHASDTLVYGVIPAAVPLIVIGTTMVGIAGSKGDWSQFTAAIVAVFAGAVALFVGPSGAWLVAGIGVFAAIIVYAVMHARSLAPHSAL